MIEYTLALGNYLNGTSAKGGARGFKLEAAFSLKKHSGSRKQNLLKNLPRVTLGGFSQQITKQITARAC